jgi:hypothetical protein
MRSTITLCLLLTVLAGTAQVTIHPPFQEKGVSPGPKCRVGEPDSPQAVIRLRCGTVPQYPPLFIVDGSPVDTSELRKINPNDIVEITVLKDAASVNTFTCRRDIGGIVLITTKKKQEVQFTIKEETRKEIIPGATIQFKSVKDKRVQWFTSNHEGKLNVASLMNDEEYDITISSIGYKPSLIRYKHELNNTAQEILLKRDEIIGAEVFVVASKRRRRGCSPDPCVRIDNSAAKTETSPEFRFVAFPNPVARGNDITIDISTAEQQAAIIRIHGRDGKLVWERSVQTVKGPNRFTVNTDSRWAAGVYFLHIISRGDAARHTQLLIQ